MACLPGRPIFTRTFVTAAGVCSASVLTAEDSTDGGEALSVLRL